MAVAPVSALRTPARSSGWVVVRLRAVRERVHRRADGRLEWQPQRELRVVERGDGGRTLFHPAALAAGRQEHPEPRRPFGARIRRRDRDISRQRLVRARRQLRDDRLARVDRASAAEADEPVDLERPRAVGSLAHRLDGRVRPDTVVDTHHRKPRDRGRATARRHEHRPLDPDLGEKLFELLERSRAEAGDSHGARVAHAGAVAGSRGAGVSP